MGLLNTFFVAANDQAAIDQAAAVGGPATGEALSGLTEIELDTLLSIISGREYDSIVEEPVRHVVDPDEQWLLEVRPDLVEALAALDPGRIDNVAHEWAETDEMSFVEPEDAAETIRSLASIASQARTAGRPLYFWGSV